MKTLREYSELKKLLGALPRSPRQTHGFFQSDCEIVKLGSANYITTSTDSVAEEITMGLYKNVETWAWMSVMNSVSDLAASGSSPLGLTLSTQWAFNTKNDLKIKFFRAVKKACRQADVAVLGGDSGYAKDHAMTTSIIGHSQASPLTRMGARPGDAIVLVHNRDLGAGPALAMSYLLKNAKAPFAEKHFRPSPSWRAGVSFRARARASIDSSDGLTIGLYTLATLNGLGFELDWIPQINDSRASLFCAKNKISTVQLWLGDLGDLHTLFVVPQKNLKVQKNQTVIGRFTKQKKYKLNYKNQKIDLPISALTNVNRDADSYLRLLKETSRYLTALD